MGYMKYCEHQMIKRDLNSCRWSDDLNETNANEDIVCDCVDLQKYIIELAEQFGCEISNKEEVLSNLDEYKEETVLEIRRLDNPKF